MIRHVLGQGMGVVVGCHECGEVQHLVDGAVHRCGNSNSPQAVTLDAAKLKFADAYYPPNS